MSDHSADQSCMICHDKIMVSVIFQAKQNDTHKINWQQFKKYSRMAILAIEIGSVSWGAGNIFLLIIVSFQLPIKGQSQLAEDPFKGMYYYLVFASEVNSTLHAL